MSVNNIGCSLNAGYKLNLACNLVESGIKDVYLIKHSNLSLDGFTYDSNDMILTLSTVGSAPWYKFDQVLETAEFNEHDNIDAKSGLRFWDSTLQLVFHRNRANLRKQTLQLMNDNRLAAIFHTNDDKYFLVGRDKGLDIEAERKHEKLFGGFNGTIIRFKGMEAYPAYEVVGSAITYSTTVITRDMISVEIPGPGHT